MMYQMWLFCEWSFLYEKWWTICDIFVNEILYVKNKNFDNSISSTYQQKDNIWKLKGTISSSSDLTVPPKWTRGYPGTFYLDSDPRVSRGLAGTRVPGTRVPHSSFSQNHLFILVSQEPLWYYESCFQESISKKSWPEDVKGNFF